MSGTITLEPIRNAEQTEASVPAYEAASTSMRPDRYRIPLFIPRSQLYYWTRAWQQGEADALDDIAAGRVRRFQSGADAARSLLDEE